MTTEPPPGSGGEPPEDDPFRKQPPPHGEGQGTGSPYDAPYGGGPYGEPPADPLAGMPPLGDSGKRTLARVIDMVLVGIVVGLLTWGFGVTQYNVDSDEVETGKQFAQSLVAAVLYVAYDTFMIAKSGQTFGKKWLGIRVANLDNGSTPSVQTSLVRALVLWLPFAFCCFIFWTIIAGGWSYFDKPFKQGLHDKAAKTVVVSAG